VKEFCQEVRRKCKGCTATDEQIRQAWGLLLRGIPERRIDALRHLSQRYRMLLLSNTNEVHWQLCQSQLDGIFERVFLSYEMGMVKPDKAIFMRMIDESRLTPAETLFIDDSEANCRTAENMGIRTLHVTYGDEWLKLLE
jgi:HAD superfamily hydrolase (TIGR01509 family)